MTEEEWLAYPAPGRMLEFLHAERGETEREGGRRKLRLFVCACVRRIWSLLRQPESVNAVEVAERYADGLVSESEMADARARGAEARAREVSEITRSGYWGSAKAAEHVTAENFRSGRGAVVFDAPYSAASAWVTEHKDGGLFSVRVNQHGAGQVDLLRCVFGNPFHPVALDARWRTPDARMLAQSAYDERLLPSGELDRQRLAILADAVEEAGCADADILSHLRGPGPHVRGCWVVDHLLGKE
jgi:hypothetical protein